MIDRLGMHRLNDTEFIDHLRRIGQQAAYPGSRLSSLCEFKNRRSHRQPFLIGCHSRESLVTANRVGKIGSCKFFEPWLVVPHFQLRRPTQLKETDGPLCLWCKVRQVGCLRFSLAGAGLGFEACQGGRTQAACTQKGAPRERVDGFGDVIHDFSSW